MKNHPEGWFKRKLLAASNSLKQKYEMTQVHSEIGENRARAIQ